MEPKLEHQRIKDLQEQLRYHNYRYYILNDPVISDGDWDQLYHELLQLEGKYPELKTQVSGEQGQKKREKCPNKNVYPW